ncbi:MAG: TVP38/TMEM64 family protein [Alphaproteobacteria bacterium]|nr:TVP38/TMEM64 family protein [Alphaproteobacteria bacterium]
MLPRTGSAAAVGAAAAWRRAARLLLLGVLSAGIIVAWRWRGAFDPLSLRAAIHGSGAAPAVFLALHVAASLLFFPRTLLAALAGLLFGMWWGVVWAALGSLLGAVAGFLVARYLNAGRIDRAGGARLGALLGRVEQGGWRLVALIRLIPVVPHSLANYGLGLTRIGLGPYAVGSFLGQLPLTVAYVDLGAAGGKLMLGGAGWLAPTLIGLTMLSASLLLPTFARRWTRRSLPTLEA